VLGNKGVIYIPLKPPIAPWKTECNISGKIVTHGKGGVVARFFSRQGMLRLDSNFFRVRVSTRTLKKFNLSNLQHLWIWNHGLAQMATIIAYDVRYSNN
jgi:hypothetical protein